MNISVKDKFLPLLALPLLLSCEEKMTQGEIIQIGIATCRTIAPFVRSLDLDPKRSGFSSSESNLKGVALVEFPADPADTLLKKTYQDPSWSQFGWMGGLTTDHQGNVYTAPVPHVSVNTPLSQLNRVYKIDAQTGKMDLAFELPAADTTQGVVPYAILGVYFDCHGHKLYVSTVAGSTREEEKGVIYVLDPENGKIVDELKGIDAIGVFVGGITGEKRLFYGSARSSAVHSIELTKSGKFKGKPRFEFTLDQLGPRGDGKARRMRLEPNGNMIVMGAEFNYSLAVQGHRIEEGYVFNYDRVTQKWNRLYP